MIGGHRLGTAPFTFDSKVGPFYRAFLISLVWLAVAAAAVLTFIAVTPDLGTVMQGERADPFSDAMLTWTIYAVIFLGLFPASAVYSAFIHNVIVNGTTLDGVHRFRSSVSPWRLVWILLSNAVVVVVSLGLMCPGRISASRATSRRIRA